MASDEENDGFGLDKQGRLAYERQQRKERQEPIALEPDFPWTANPSWDPDFFGIPANPQVKES